MSCLARFAYDPAAAVLKSATALLAMTVIDSANCRLTFTAPASGKVYIRLACSIRPGSATPFWPVIHLGVIDANGAALVHRQLPMVGVHGNIGAVGTVMKAEVGFVVPGLTPGTVYNYDAAYGVDLLVSGSGIQYGGPNTATTASDAGGAIVGEVWDA